MTNTLVLFTLFLFGVANCDQNALRGTAETWECDLCSVIMDYVLLDPNTSVTVEHLIDKFCVILPTECEALVHDLAVLLKFIELQLSRGELDSGFALCSMINKCSFDCCLTPSEPEQVHISFIGDPHSSIGVTWATLENVGSYVKYGVSPNTLSQIASGSTKTYTEKAWIGWIHNVALTNLKPGTKYYYSVGSNPTSSSGWSKVFSFTTESLDSSSQVLRILEIGDMGAGDQSNDTVKRLIDLVSTQEFNFMIHNGDISYADGYQARWDTYFRKVEDAVANIPYMTTLGNHEIGIIGALNLSIGYIHRFMLPGEHAISNDYSNMYYSWDYGLVHFLSIDTENSFDLPDMTVQQIAWIESDLASVNRTKTPWVIVYGHRPLYCSNPDDDCGSMANFLKANLEQTFNKYKVDLIFSAHKHNYERMWPIKPGGIPVKTLTNPGAPLYILNGAGGNREGETGSHVAKDFSVYYLAKWGYGILTIQDSSTLKWDFYQSSTNQLMDSLTLVVNH